MARSEAQKRADKKWQRDNIKTAACRLRTSEYDAFKKYAEDHGKTISGMLLEYVRRCISESSGD